MQKMQKRGIIMYTKLIHPTVGYWTLEKKMTYEKRLEYCPYGSCGIRTHGPEICLVSYETEVIRYNQETGKIEVTGIYSRTTMKHIAAFLREYLPEISYQQIKECYQKMGGEMYR
jgi:hypothetical protein